MTSEESRQKSVKAIQSRMNAYKSNKSTGVKNITIDQNGAYRVEIMRNGIVFRRSFDSLAEAIFEKKRVLDRFEAGIENWNKM